MRRFLTSLVVGLVAASVASACLNDSELPGHEREFRSAYNRSSEPEKSQDSWFSNATPIALLSGGSVFLIAAGVIATRRISGKK
jgi:hypothetical protein